jgi:hypothetical protein
LPTCCHWSATTYAAGHDLAPHGCLQGGDGEQVFEDPIESIGVRRPGDAKLVAPDDLAGGVDEGDSELGAADVNGEAELAGFSSRGQLRLFAHS